MAFSLWFRYTSFLLLFSSFFFLCALPTRIESVEENPPFSFSFEKFDKNRSFGSGIALFGDAEIRNSRVRMFGDGKVMVKQPIRFVGTNPGFSTYFAFSVSKGSKGSLDFTMARSNITSVLAVQLGAYVGIEFGDGLSVNSSNLAAVDWVLNSGKKLHSWIDYDGVSKMIEVRVSRSKDSKPLNPLLSFGIDLSNVLWKDAIFVGLRSSGRNSTERCDVFSWSFVVKHGVPYLMHSEPLDPQSPSVRSHEDLTPYVRRNFTWKILIALLFGICFGAMVAVLFFLKSKVTKRHPVAPVEYPVLPMEIENQITKMDGIKVQVESAAK